MNIKYPGSVITIFLFIGVLYVFCQSNRLEAQTMATNQFKEVTDKSMAPLFAEPSAVNGLVVGVVRGNQTEVYGYGKVGKKPGGIPDGETLFGIASITKSLTALLLAQLSVEGKLTYDDIAFRFKDKSVTFRQLVTHISGLPLLPSNLKDSNADYSLKEFRSFLHNHSLKRDPGNQFEYSTIGFGVLGITLAQKSKSDSFEKCLRKKVLAPLGMSSSVFELAQKDASRFAGSSFPAASQKGKRPFNASGGLISSLHDLLRFVSANLQPQLHPELVNAIMLTQKFYPEIQTFPGSIAALGWNVLTPSNFYW